MKRFYKLVTTDKTPEGFCILLDGKNVKTPSGQGLMAPNEALAQAVVKEWAGQGEEILPQTMPLTQILSTKIDRVRPERVSITQALLKYLNTDLICYRADSPPELAEKQARAWDPFNTWFESTFGVALETTTGLQALEQPEDAHKKASEYIEDLDDDHFTVLQILTAGSGSLILAMAFCEEGFDIEDVFNAAFVEELYKAELYNENVHGGDPQQEKKQASMRQELGDVKNFLALLRNNM